jgi:kinesin family protein 1
MYSLELTPPLARTARELWRLDTAKKPVAGENLLMGWKPRTIALVRDYGTLVRVRNVIADVQTTKVLLDNHVDYQTTAAERDEEAQHALVQKCAGLWVREMETRVEVRRVMYEK